MPSLASWANKLPMESSVADMYSFKGLPKVGGVSIGGFTRHTLICSKAFCCSLIQMKSSAAFDPNRGKKAYILPAKFAMNLLRKLSLLIRLCSSFFFLRGLASNTTFVLFLSTSITWLWTKKPRKLLAETAKALHFHEMLLHSHERLF